MLLKEFKFTVLLASALLVTSARAATFGTVYPIEGEASDIALDTTRGVLYVANFTANRVDKLSATSGTYLGSISVEPQPGSIAISPNGMYLVTTHYDQTQAPNGPPNAVTIINLTNNQQLFTILPWAPLAVAFGNDNRALIATTNDFELLDPSTNTIRIVATVADVSGKIVPVPPASFPPQITGASMGSSADGNFIFGLTDTVQFQYNVAQGMVYPANYTSSPTMGPRVVSVNQNGTRWIGGWVLNDQNGNNVSQFPNPAGALNVGSAVIDSARDLIYADMPSGSTSSSGTGTGTGSSNAHSEPAVLQIVDGDNLAVYDQVNLPEHLAGRGLMSADNNTMYVVSDSGVMFIPVGQLASQHRIAASAQPMTTPVAVQNVPRVTNLLFEGGFCNRGAQVQNLSVFDPGGGSTPFAITATQPGVTVSPASGVTPATVQVTIDPAQFGSQTGTTVVPLQIVSPSAIDVPTTVNVMINFSQPNQRGTIMNVPGTLVDLLPDPVRNRFYVLRQDTNQVLIFDSNTYHVITTLKTANTPTQMALSRDNTWLYIGHDNSQFVYAYDLNSLAQGTNIPMPFGHYPRSVAAANGAILAASRSASPPNAIDEIYTYPGVAYSLPSLGVFQNSINISTVLVPSPDGRFIMAAEADGNVLLYDSVANTFVVSRQDTTALSGAYAANTGGQYVIGNELLDASLVQQASLDPGTNVSSGFAFTGASAGIRTSAPDYIEQLNLSDPGGMLGMIGLETPTMEAPLAGNTAFPFTRTLGVLPNQSLVSLSTSGFTILPMSFAAATTPPAITGVVSAADGTPNIAPGGLISIKGWHLSPISQADSQMPMTTAIGDSCVIANGIVVPVMYVSPTQINAQLPFEVSGTANFTLYTPGGISGAFQMNVPDAAPTVFSAAAGPGVSVPTVIRTTNHELVTPANPIHPGDKLTIYLTGLGQTNPAVADGAAAPSKPLAASIVAPTVTIGGENASVIWAGMTPGFAGLYEIDVALSNSDSIHDGMAEPLVITAGGGTTTVSVRVVH